jgi:hypothetical protein
MDAIRLGVLADAVEKHRLADAAQADEHRAFRRPADLRPRERDAQRLAQLVAAREFRRPGTGAGREGVADRVHGTNLSHY